MHTSATTWFSRFVDWAPYVAGLAALVIPIIFTTPRPMTMEAIYIALGPGGMLSILVFLVSDRLATGWQQRQQQRQLLEYLSQIEEAQRGLDRVRYLGSPEEAIKYVGLCIQKARVCWNTYLNFDVADGFGYSTENHGVVMAAMREFLQDGQRKWIDVISGVTDEFRDRIAYACEGVKRSNYQCFRLNVNAPAMNFIIMDYGGGRRPEVVFGWGRHPKDDLGKVFTTDNELLVDAFSALHGSLRDRAVSTAFDPVEDRELHGRNDNTIIGEWFVGPGKAAPGESLHGSPVEDVAIVSIERVRGRVELSGYIFEMDGRRRGRCTALAVREYGGTLDVLMEETGVFGRNKVTYVAKLELIAPNELRATYYDLRAKGFVNADCMRLDTNDRWILRGTKGQWVTENGVAFEATDTVMKYNRRLENMA